MAQVMNSHVLKPGALTDAAPGSLQIGEVRGRQLAGDDPEIVLLAGQGGQHGAGLGTERHDPPAGLGVTKGFVKLTGFTPKSR